MQSRNCPQRRFTTEINASGKDRIPLSIAKDNFTSFYVESPGLTTDPEFVSFRSSEDAKYLVNSNLLLELKEFEDSDEFRKAASFRIIQDKFFEVSRKIVRKILG